MFVLLVVMLLVGFSGYAIWDSGQVIGAASSENYRQYRPMAEDGDASFEQLQMINADVFGWLTVFGTNIDYPVVQGTDNIRYVNTDARGRHALSGAIFLDYRNCPWFSDFNSIFYGHHMQNRVMFGEIELFANREYFHARRYGMLYFNGHLRGLEFFAFVHADAYDLSVFRVRIAGQEQQQAYLDLLLDMAVHVREDVPVTIGDRIVLLSTCSETSTNGRDILIGRITGETFNNPFAQDVEETQGIIAAIDTLSGLWARAGFWGRLSVMALPLLLILLAVFLIYTKRQRR